MPLTIITKFYPPTATRGARFVAKTPDPKLPSRSVGAGGIPALENREAEHRYAANLFREQLGWKGTLIGGEIAPGEWAWIQLPSQYEAAVEAVLETRLAIRKGENSGNPFGRKWGKAVSKLTDDGGPLEQDYAELERAKGARESSTPYGQVAPSAPAQKQVRGYVVTCPCHPGEPRTEKFNLFHAAECGAVLSDGGLPLPMALRLIDRWNKAAKGQFTYRLLED